MDRTQQVVINGRREDLNPADAFLNGDSDLRAKTNTAISAKQVLVALEAVNERSTLHVENEQVSQLVAQGLLHKVPQSEWEKIKETRDATEQLYSTINAERKQLNYKEYELDHQERAHYSFFASVGYGFNALFGGDKGQKAEEQLQSLQKEVSDARQDIKKKELAADLLQRELDTSYDTHLLGDTPVRLTSSGKTTLKTLSSLRGSLSGQTVEQINGEIQSFDTKVQTILGDGAKIYSALLGAGYQRDDEALQSLAITVAKSPTPSDKTLKLLSEVERDITSYEVDGKKKLQLLQIVAGKEYPAGARTESLESNASRVKLLSKMVRGTFAAHYVAAQLFGAKEVATSSRVQVFDDVFKSLLKKGFKHAAGQGAYLASRIALRPNPTDALKKWEKAYKNLGGSTSSISSGKAQAALILSGLPGSESANFSRYQQISKALNGSVPSGTDATVLAAQLATIPGDVERVMFLFNKAHAAVKGSWITTNGAHNAVGLIGGAMMELVQEASQLAQVSTLAADSGGSGGYGYDSGSNSSFWFIDTGSSSFDTGGSSGFESLGGFSSGDVGFSAGDIGGFSDGGAGCASSGGFSSGSSFGGSSCGSSSCGSSSGGGSSCGSSGGSSCGGGGSSCGGGGGCGGGGCGGGG